MDFFPYGLKFEHDAAHVPNNMSAMHMHAYHELYFLLSGQRRYFVGHTIYDVAPGNLVLIPKTQLHRTIALGHAGYDRYLVYFPDTPHQSFIDLLGASAFERLMESGCLTLPPGVVRQIQKDFEQMESEFNAPDAFSVAALSHLLHGILLSALRFGRPKAPCRGEIADRIQEAARYISEHYTAELTLHDAAQVACMEDTYFSKRFKALTGFGFHEYLTLTRLRAAEQLLKDPCLSMGEIAEHSGFSSSNYFGDVFKRIKGISPSDYRKQLL